MQLTRQSSATAASQTEPSPTRSKANHVYPATGGTQPPYENDSVCPSAKDLRRTLGNLGVRSLHQGPLNANIGSEIFHHEQHLVSLQVSLEGEKDMNR